MACPRLRRALQVFLWQTLQRSKKSRNAQARRFFRAPQQERRPRRSVQVWRYLRSKLTALSRQGKLELTRRWRVWSASNKRNCAQTGSPHPPLSRSPACRKATTFPNWRRLITSIGFQQKERLRTPLCVILSETSTRFCECCGAELLRVAA